MKFAFILMGDYASQKDRCAMHGGDVQLIGVSSVEEAVNVAKELYKEGIDCIELCGAFLEEGTRQVIAATEGKIPVGYVVHLPEQDELFTKLFG